MKAPFILALAATVVSATSTPSAAAPLSTDQLVQKAQSLRSLSDNERSVLVSDIRADAQMRLVGPEVSILSAVDHVRDAVDLFQPVYMKLQARIIAEASTTATSTSTSAMRSSLADMDAKLTDASSQGTAAQTEALALKPDQGNRTLLQTNKASLRDARSKAKAAIQDLIAARKDADDILGGLR